MKHTNKQILTINPIAEAKKNKNFYLHSISARLAVRLAALVYEKRKQREWSQTMLAEKIGTTQKVISYIESGDEEIRMNLLKRLVDGLGLSNDDLGHIFESSYVFSFQNNTANEMVKIEKNRFSNTANNITYEANQC